jgi:hypothetical protein
VEFDFDGFESFNDFVTHAFNTCINNNAFIWGTYPVFNKFFRITKQEITTELNFICGVFYGFINRRLFPANHEFANKEDFLRTINYFLHDGIVIRFNRVGYKTQYYGDRGGLGTFDERLEPSRIETIKLHEMFPDITSIKIRKNEMHEIVLKKVHAFKPHIPIELEPFNDDKCALKLLDETKFVHCKNKMGRARTFGEHESLTLGYVTARVQRTYGLSFQTIKNQKLYDELLRIGKIICPFEFKTIQLNKNVQSPPHKDKNNSTLSCIIAFGDYEGLDLVINDKIYNIKNKPLVFDGINNKHWNTPLIRGTKYSIVYF